MAAPRTHTAVVRVYVVRERVRPVVVLLAVVLFLAIVSAVLGRGRRDTRLEYCRKEPVPSRAYARGAEKVPANGTGRVIAFVNNVVSCE
jgi:hypothetical protein